MSANAEELQRRWKGVAACFPLWRFPVDLFIDVNSWRMFGSDITTMLMKSKHARRAALAMEGAAPELLDQLTSIARVNEGRSTDLFRAVFLGYVSAPFAMAALLSDAAPNALSSLIRDQANALVILLIGSLVFPVVYYCANWRAKQIAWTIELYRAGAIAPLPAKAAA